MAATVRLKNKQTETDIAVLQTQVANINEKIDDLKSDIAEIKHAIELHAQHSAEMMNEFKKENSEQHAELAKKVSTLEKWRWMIMGAAALAGALGFSAARVMLIPG